MIPKRAVRCGLIGRSSGLGSRHSCRALVSRATVTSIRFKRTTQKGKKQRPGPDASVWATSSFVTVVPVKMVGVPTIMGLRPFCCYLLQNPQPVGGVSRARKPPVPPDVPHQSLKEALCEARSERLSNQPPNSVFRLAGGWDECSV